MKLTIIGAGISSDITISALESIKNADEVYVERYTGVLSDEKLKEMGSLTGKEIRNLERKDVESDFLIKRAMEKEVVLISSGDPLTATTHIVLLIDAKEKGVETRVIHNSSIYTAAAGKTGLQIYRFGKTATIPNPRPNYKPSSWFDIIKHNLENNAHTLVLLDTEPEPMDAKKAIEMIEEMDVEKSVEKMIVLSKIGWKDEKINLGSLKELKEKNLGKPPFCLIIPAELHVVEKEYLEKLE